MKTAVFVLALVAAAVAAQMRWPVFFERLGQVHSVHNRFDLTVDVRAGVPSLQMRIRKLIHKLDLLSEDFEGVRVQQRQKGQRRRSRLDELNDSWRRQNAQLKARTEAQRRRAADLRALGGGGHAEPLPEAGIDKNRRSRLLFRKKRQILKGLLGLAYTADLDGISKRVGELDNRMNSGMTDVRSKTDRLRSSTRQMIQGQTAELRNVEDMAERLERKVRGPLWGV